MTVDDEAIRELREAADRYAERFGDDFPLMMWGGSLGEAAEEMRRRVESGEPYELDEGVVY